MNGKSSKIAMITILAGLLVCAYPVFVLGYTWIHVARAKLPGGRGGPLDAYRHTLASAVVAYTTDKRAVDWVSRIMERGGSGSNEMDRRNNGIGASIGLRARTFSEIEPAVLEAIQGGAENATSPDRITWLSRDHWHDRLFW